MKVCALALAATSLLLASDRPLTPAALKAQVDFDRVQLALRPPIPASEACIQSQAAALAVSLPEDRSLFYFHKAWCAFAGAAATGDAPRFLAAAAGFDQAIQSWPAPAPKSGHRPAPEPVPAALRVFAAIARLKAADGTPAIDGARREIEVVLEAPSCYSRLMPAAACGELLSAGAQWLGWSALLSGRLDEAERRFARSPGSGWPDWVSGRLDFAAARYPGAAARYATAIARWKEIWQADGPTFWQSLGPRPQFAAALADWGGARLLAGDPMGAILTLDAAIQADPANPHALFLRARAKEVAGRQDDALSDYNLASRTAFAAARDLASGEAHLYRGILLFRRRDFARAEEEFSSALNFEMTGELRPDARAWRHLAAVAGGACGTSRESLQGAMASASPFFPHAEARSLLSACGDA